MTLRAGTSEDPIIIGGVGLTQREREDYVKLASDLEKRAQAVGLCLGVVWVGVLIVIGFVIADIIGWI